MREGGGRVVDVNQDTTITTFRGGVAHAHTVCPYTVLWVYVAPIRKEESTYSIQTGGRVVRGPPSGVGDERRLCECLST